jgi:hypothetical protein
VQRIFVAWRSTHVWQRNKRSDVNNSLMSMRASKKSEPRCVAFLQFCVWDGRHLLLRVIAQQRVEYKPPDMSGRVLMTDERFAEQEKQRRAAEEAAIAAKQAERKAADEECRRIIAEQLKAKQDEREREREIGVREALAAKARAEQMEIEVCRLLQDTFFLQSHDFHLLAGC